MTKKLILAGSILATSLFGATNAQIETYFKSKIPVPTVKVKVTSRMEIKEIKGMDYVSIVLSDGKRNQKVSVFTQGNLIFPDVISVNGGSIKDKLDKEKLVQEISKIYKVEKPENILVLGNDPKKETLVVFTDPECPFCGKEVEKIEETLKVKNLKLIFTPVHDKSALEKSVLIKKQTDAAKTIEEKIKIVKKYFNGTVDEKVTDEEVAKIDNNRKKYFAAGLKGVPFDIAEKDLLK